MRSSWVGMRPGFPLPAKGTILQSPGAIRRVEVVMFDSLEQQMRKNEDRVSTSQGRMMRYGLYALAGMVVLGGLIYAMHLIG